MSVLSVTQRGTTLRYDPETLLFSVERDGAVWRTTRAPYVLFKHNEGPKPDIWTDGPGDLEEVALTRAAVVDTQPWKTGLGEGFITRFEGIPGTSMTCETLLWVDNCRGELFAELIPYEDPKNEWYRIYFPTAFDFSEQRPDCYSVVNVAQGVLVPNDRPYTPHHFDYAYSGGPAYMPWFGQVRGRDAYIAIATTPWDGDYHMQGETDGPKTIASCWRTSLGRVGYRRTARYSFIQGDYNDLCKVYRQYAAETGLLVTLKEKAVRNPNVGRLVGCAIVHEGIYRNISPLSRYYDAEHPEENVKLEATFDERAAQLRALKEKWGLDKIYFHMDGWGVEGYDSHHPDYLPPYGPAGGWEGMARLSDTMEELGYIFSTHDQYRDYYFNAPSYDEQMAVRNAKGEVYTHSCWYGGWQALLCGSQAPGYVRRNYSALEEHGVHLTGTYQDVFTVESMDECDHPWHRMTRKECVEYRCQCMDYVTAHGIAISSECAVDAYMRSFAFCHWAPLGAPLRPKAGEGISVPLFNLVYHDCLIQPCYGDVKEDGFDDLLEGLLMGEPIYLPIEPTQAQVDRYKVAARLQEAVQYKEMLRHELIAPAVHRTTFDGGITVTIDAEKNTYRIEGLD